MRRFFLESAVPHQQSCRRIRRGPQLLLSSGGAGARGFGDACPRGPTVGSGDPQQDGPVAGRITVPPARFIRQQPHRSQRHPPPLLGRRSAARREGWTPLGVRGVPRGLSCPLLEDVGGRHLVLCSGGGVHRVPCQVLQHRSAGVEPIRRQWAFCGLCGPSCHRERQRFVDRALAVRVRGQVGQRYCACARLGPGADALVARAEG